MLISITIFGALLHICHVWILLHVGHLSLPWLGQLLKFSIQKHLVVLCLSLNLACWHLAHLFGLCSGLFSSSSRLLWLVCIVRLLNVNLAWLARRVLHHLLVLHCVNRLLILNLRLACSVFDHRLVQIVSIRSHANATLNLLKRMLLVCLQLVLLWHCLCLRSNASKLHLVAVQASNLLNIDGLSVTGICILLDV